MIIVFILDNYGEFSNGTTITAMRTKALLEERGHTVRVVSAGPLTGENYFTLKKRYIPIVTEVSRRQNMYFAKPDESVLRAAFEGADLIHFFMPFKLSQAALKLAKKLDIPFTAAFHTQPENITYGAGLGRLGRPIAWMLYQSFLNDFYRHVKHIHCPSQFVASEMRHNNYKSHLHVISNGIGDDYRPMAKEKTAKAKRQILSIGRYAPEKKQDIIIKAIAKSTFKDQIQLVLAGFGPLEGRYKRLAKRLGVDVRFAFFNRDDLKDVILDSDLYVHAAEAEIEGIACLEAIASGIVPIIAKSKKSAASQFALDDGSLFETRNVKQLTERIDFWLENDPLRHEAAEAYAKSAEKYRISHSLDLFEEMLKEALFDHRRLLTTKTKKGKKLKKHITFPWYKRAMSFIVYYFIAIPFLWLFIIVIKGVRIKNAKIIRRHKGGGVLVSNHVHTLDSAMNGLAAFPRKPVYTGLKANFKLPVAGFLVNILGTVPVPETPDEMKVFFHELQKQVHAGRLVHFFPEAHLIEFYSTLRPFKNGAFQVAKEAMVPVIPIGISFRDKKGIFPLFSKKRILIKVGNPIQPDLFELKKPGIETLSDAAFRSMQELISQ